MDDGDVARDPIPGQLFQDLANWRRSDDHTRMLALRDSYSYQPEAYLDCVNAPVVATLETGVGHRGYTVHLHLLQTENAKGAVLRLITANEGIGLDLCILERDTLAVRVIPEESEWTKLTALPPQWSSITCVHVNIPKAVMHVYINGGHTISTPVSYPTSDRWTSQTLMTMLGGGYTGRIALCAVFGDPLPHRAVTFLHAVPVNYQPHFNEQHSFSVMGFPITATAAYPSGGGAFPELPRIDHVPGQMALFPRTLIYLSAITFSDLSCDPLPFPNRAIDILQGVKVHRSQNLQSCFEAGGGLRLFLVAISPSFLGRRFVDAVEATAVVELLASLLRGCVSFVYDLAVMGAVSLHKLIYSWIEPQHRSVNLLQATKSLLTAVDMVDITSSKHLFLDFFTTTLLDFAFWSDASDDCQRLLSEIVIALVTPNPTVFAHAISVEGFIYHFNCLKAKTNQILSECCLQCITLIATSKDLFVLFRTVLAVRGDAGLQSKFLRTLSKLAFEDSATFRDLILSDSTLHFRALLMISSSTDDSTSRIGLRLLGIVLVMMSPPLRSSMARTAALFIEENLRLTADVYASLIQLLVGEITPGTAQSDNATFHDEHVIQMPEMLPSLFSLMRSSNDDALVDRILMDILSIIKINDRNKMAFTRNPFWQRWVIPYCEDQSSVRSQIGLQILSAALLYCCCEEDKGWVSVDQTLFLLEANKHRPDQEIFNQKCSLFLELVSQLSRSSSMEFGPESSPLLLVNLKPTLQLIEQLLFESDYSFLNDPEQAFQPDQLVLLERLLITALKFLPFPERREHIVRLVLRYIQVVLPRPESNQICPVILGAASQVFGLMLGEKNAVNLRVVQMAVSFLKAAAKALHDTDFDGSLDVERVVQSLVHVWGTGIFTDLNQQAVDTEDSDRVSLLNNRDDDVMASEINSSLPVILSDEQIYDRSLEIYNRLRSKFVSVVSNRMDKLNRMLGEYSNKVSETLATKQLSDVKAQNEFHQRLSTVAVSVGAVPPTTIQAIGQRNSYLMSRSVLALKRFRDAFEYSAERNHDNSYWRVDPTENPMRMRYLLKRNSSGDNHPNASARPADARAFIDVTALPAVIASGTPEEDTTANESSEEKSTTEWPNEPTEEDEEPVGFNIDRPGEAADDAVPVQAAQPILVVNCTLISLTRKIDGEFTIFGDSLRFVGKQEHRSPGDAPEQSDGQPATAADAPNGSAPALDQLMPFKPRSHYWLLRDIRQVLPRRYLLRECGMEIFTKNYRSYFFTFDRPMRTKVYKRICNLLRLPAELSNMRRLRYSGITEKWVNRQISNYEYLAHLNTIAGRTYNDITQYPVYPSIIRDFESETLDLSNPDTFRDLSKPIGALNPERLQAFEAKYQDMVEIGDPAMPPFHYGSHYLSAGIVLYYLVRLEPFTTLGIQLQGGRFDLPDRLFTSIKGAWDLSISNLSDVKELIPEFFYLPEFLKNLNNLPLGLRQDGSPVGDVILPPWAKSPEQFVALHRQALESDYVSAHLPEWIDLIFGYKQRGQEAINAKNVFFHLTYAGAVDIDLIKDDALRQATVAQIYHFGQTPSQLFDKPHPHQKPLDACNPAPRACFPFPPQVRSSPKLNWTSETKLDDCMFSDIVVTRSDMLVHCYADDNGDLRYRSRALTAVAAASLPSISVPIKIRKSFGVSALSRTGQLLLCGGMAKGALECYLCPTGRLISRSYAGHYAPITCMEIDPDQSYLITGARNGTVCIWSVFLKRHAWSRPPILSNATSTFTLQGVVSPVTCVAICAALGVCAAAFGDGTCALFSVRRKSLIRAFRLPERQQIDLVHIAASARLILTSRNMIYLYTCNARLLRALDWGYFITHVSSNKSGESVVVGGRGSNRVTVHSFCELDKIDEFEYRSETSDSEPYPVVVDFGPKENFLAVALSNQTVFLTQVATNKNAEGDPSLFAASVDMARDFANNTLEVLRESLDSPLEITKQAVSQVNDQIVDALDRSAEAAGSSKVWQSLSKVKGKLFGGGGAGPKHHA